MGEERDEGGCTGAGRASFCLWCLMAQFPGLSVPLAPIVPAQLELPTLCLLTRVIICMGDL